MPKLAQTLLADFGRAVKHARSTRGWELNDVARRIGEMDGGKSGTKAKPPARSFLSDIEKGKRSISPPTVGKLIHALDLPKTWLDRFLAAAPDDIDEETPTDREADRLIRMVEADETAPPTSEVLLLLLAEEWAGQRYIDPMMAYTALKGALQVAADLRAQGNLPSNASAQLQAVLRRVSELTDAGQLDEADAALKDATDRNEAEAEALFDAALQQDRLRNRPAMAAQRLVARLKSSAPPGGVFGATRDLLNEWRGCGERIGDPFDLAVALELAKLNHASASSSQLGQALLSLGNCHLVLGKRQSGEGHLNSAIAAYTAQLKICPPELQPRAWANAQLCLGSALRILGVRAGNKTNLRGAISAFTDPLTVYTLDAAPMDWAKTHNSLGNALRALGTHELDRVSLLAAITAYTAALTIFTTEVAPMDWAMTQHNLADTFLSLHTLEKTAIWLDRAEDAFRKALVQYTTDQAEYHWANSYHCLGKVYLARFRMTGDRVQLDLARHHLTEARVVFALDPNNITLNDFDRLLAEIAAA